MPLRKRQKIDPSTLNLEDRVVSLRRVAKVITGGKRFRFTALVVVGDRLGHVGAGLGKAREVPEAIEKGKKEAIKNLIKIPLWGTTIPHEVFGEWGAAKVFIKPAAPGTGVIASGPVRAVLELAGVRDALSKCLGSTNPINVVKACLLALSELRSAAEIARLRGKKVKDLFVRWRDEKAEVPADNSEEKSDREKLETPQDSPGSGAEEAAADSGQTG